MKILESEISILYRPFKYAKIESQKDNLLNKVTSSITVNIGKEHYNKAVMLVNEQQERRILPRSNEDDFKYEDENISKGKYRILLSPNSGENMYTRFFNIEDGKKNILNLK